MIKNINDIFIPSLIKKFYWYYRIPQKLIFTKLKKLFKEKILNLPDFMMHN